MNKLMGFYELKDSGLPCVNWKEYVPGKTLLDVNKLWTIRTAVYNGADFNLPRKVGVAPKEASEFAEMVCEKIKDTGMVVYYPFFTAEKSGTLEVSLDYFVIEAVKGDLWNFVTDGKFDVHIDNKSKKENIIGMREFFSIQELEELKKYINMIRNKFKNDLLEGKSILVEWSFAHDYSDIEYIIEKSYLIFYEMRTI